MLTQPIPEKVRQMKLLGLAEAFASQCQQPDMSRACPSRSVSASWWTRSGPTGRTGAWPACSRRPGSASPPVRRTSITNHPAPWTGPPCAPWPGASGSARQNVLIDGPTGAGKTFIACALANAAARQGFSSRCYRVSRLIQEPAVAKTDGSYPRLLSHLARIHLLVPDDWGLPPPHRRRDPGYAGDPRRPLPDAFHHRGGSAAG